MPIKKKTASPKASAPKKAAPKKAAPKKAAPKAAPKKLELVTHFEPVHMYLHTNSGEQNISFSSKVMFDAAMRCIEGAPKKSTGGRSVPTHTITYDGGTSSFQILKRYAIKS